VRFLHAGRLESVLIGFKADIVKIQASPILSQIDHQDLKELNKNIQTFLPTKLVPPLESPMKASSEMMIESNK